MRPTTPSPAAARRRPISKRRASCFRNDGGGKFTDVSAESGACPAGLACRSVCATDFDGDGLLDLFVGECFFQGGQSRTRLYRNLGGLKFENVSEQVGLPERLTGFGVAAADVNGDGRPDLLVGGRHHGNRLLVSTADRKFREVPASLADFTWTYGRDGDDTSCGVCFGDVNRDGRLDIVIGSHFSQPWRAAGGGVPVRLYLHQGVEDGLPAYRDVTDEVGLVPLPMKSPHVEIQDFDNDGWPDIYTSIVKFDAEGRPHPVIFKHLGIQDGLPQFRCEALAVNDFPTADDLAVRQSGKFFDKMIADKKIVYMAPGPTCDFNRDGKLDMFLPNWWPQAKSLLLANETPGGHWLQIAVQGGGDVNRQGIGSRVLVYPPGKLGEAEALLAAQGNRRRLWLCFRAGSDRPHRPRRAGRVRCRGRPAARQGKHHQAGRESRSARGDLRPIVKHDHLLAFVLDDQHISVVRGVLQIGVAARFVLERHDEDVREAL